MTIEEALSILDTLLDQVPLNDVQELVFRHAWDNWTYDQMAAQFGYTTDYIRTVGSQLWGALSQLLGVPIRKNNLQSQVRRWAQQQQPPGLPPADWSARNPRVDLTEAPDVSHFVGRVAALDTLTQWVKGTPNAHPPAQSACRFIALLGMGGIGKTALAAKLVQTVTADFDAVIWRSLRHAPPLEELLITLIQFFAPEAEPAATLPGDRHHLITMLIEHLRERRCLIILDNAESVLPCHDGGRKPTSGYTELLDCLADLPHAGCVVLTSREKPDAIAWKEGLTLPVRSFSLAGLSDTEAQTIFAVKGQFTGSAIDWHKLIQHYAGNPLALKMVATAIQDVFNGNLSEFLAVSETLVFDDIQDLLDRQFDRLAPVEQAVMFWLAINRTVTSFQTLRDDILCPLARQALPSALRTLKHRFLIEATAAGFTQQPVVMDYVTHRLLDQVSQEFLQPLLLAAPHSVPSVTPTTALAATTGNQLVLPLSLPTIAPAGELPPPPLLQTHALLKATAPDYIRDSQTRLILTPLLERLVARLRSLRAVESQCRAALRHLQTHPQAIPGYAAGNLVNLLQGLQADLTGLQFSPLTLRQVPFQTGTWQQVDLSHCTLKQCVFLDTLSTVWAVAFSPDGELLAASDATGRLHFWRVTDHQKVMTWQGHPNWVCAIAFSPDSQWLASGSIGNVIKLWEVRTGNCLHTLTGHTEWVLAVAFHPQGQILASGSADGTIKLWQAQTGVCLQTLTGHQGWVSAIAFSPDGTLLASGSDDGTVKLWEVQTATCCQTLTRHQGAVRTVAFSPTGEQLASGSSDRTIHLWHLPSGDHCGTLTGHHHPIRAIAYQPHDPAESSTARLISASEDGTLRIWQPATQDCLQVIPGHQGHIRAVAIHPSRQWFASGGADQTVKLWDLTGQCLQSWRGYTNAIRSVACAPATLPLAVPRLIASGSSDRTVRLWDLQTGDCLHTLRGHTNEVWSVAFSPTPVLLAGDPEPKPLLASGSTDQTIRLWELHTGQCLQILQGHHDWIHAIAFHPTAPLLASASSDQTVRLWNVTTGTCDQILNGHTSHVWGVAFSPTHPILASSSDDHTVKLWDLETGACRHTLTGHTRRVQAIAFSPDGQWLASSSSDQTIAIWEVKSGRCLRTLTPSGDHVRAIAFGSLSTPSDQPPIPLRLYSYSKSTLHIWNVQTGELVRSLSGHTHPIWSIALSADGHTLISGSEDNTLRLWDTQSGECYQVWHSPYPYQGMNIRQVVGMTAAQQQTLKALGAVAD